MKLLKFTLEGKFVVHKYENESHWEVYWPNHGFIAVDGDTKEEIEATWPKQKAEIIAQLLGEDL